MRKSTLSFVAPITVLGALVVYFLALPDIAPPSPDEQAEVAVGFIKAKQKALAQDELREALAKDPKNHRANYVAGMLALDEGDYTAAESHLKAACEAKPDDWDALLSLGVVYQNLKNYPDAGHCYERIAKAQPANAKVYYNMGMMDIEILQYGLAKHHLEKYLALSPKAADTAFVKAKLVELSSRLKGQKHS